MFWNLFIQWMENIWLNIKFLGGSISLLQILFKKQDKNSDINNSTLNPQQTEYPDWGKKNWIYNQWNQAQQKQQRPTG